MSEPFCPVLHYTCVDAVLFAKQMNDYGNDNDDKGWRELLNFQSSL